MSQRFEVNFDGLIGPTHNYSGQSYGNLASAKNAQAIAYPKRAALQGLEKMKRLADLGFAQGVIPPLKRPHTSLCDRLGITDPHGGAKQKILKIRQLDDSLIPLIYSASSMWAANAATVTPSCDSYDGRVHFTPANLLSMPHRAIESAETHKLLSRMFSDRERFQVHRPLPSLDAFSDEGAANHTRLSNGKTGAGISLFTYGCSINAGKHSEQPRRFPARQTMEASRTIAMQHLGEKAERDAWFIQQAPQAIDAGAFHNDVVAVGNNDVLFYHGSAFLENSLQQGLAPAMSLERFAKQNTIRLVKVSEDDISLDDAVSSYLFNSQLISHPDSDSMMLICPTECRENKRIYDYLVHLTKSDSPIDHVEFVNVRESMSNGGGPACLRLRVNMLKSEYACVPDQFKLDDNQYRKLRSFVERSYPDSLSPHQLFDPELSVRMHDIFSGLGEIFDLEAFYQD